MEEQRGGEEWSTDTEDPATAHSLGCILEIVVKAEDHRAYDMRTMPRTAFHVLI